MRIIYYLCSIRNTFRRMYRTILMALALVLMVLGCSGNKSEPGQEVVDTVPMMVTQLKKCSRLYTTEIRVHKIITHNDEKTIKGSFLGNKFNINLPLSKRQVAIPMEATLKTYVDFGKFGEDNVRRRGDRIEITLPDPQVELTGTRIDNKGIKRYVDFARSNFTDAELTAYERQGRASIVKSIPQMKIMEQARQNAANVIIPMVAQMGFKEENITVNFRKDFNYGDITRLLLGNTERRTGNE